MICINCKKQVPDSAKFCPHCGAPVKKKRTALWASLICLAVLAVGIGAFFIIKGISGSNTKSADPAAAALAVAEKEWRDLLDGIDESDVKRLTNDPEAIHLILSFRELKNAGHTMRLYSVADSVPGGTSGDPVRLVTGSVQREIDSYGTTVIAATSILRSMSIDNSYPCPWNQGDCPAYMVEVLVSGRTRAVISVRFNEFHAIQTETIPLIAEMDLSLPDLFYEEGRQNAAILSSVDIQNIETEGVLERLTPSAGYSGDPGEMALLLAKTIAGRAMLDHLKELNIPDDLIPYCQLCEIFLGEPFKVIKWDLSAPSSQALASLFEDEELTKQEYSRVFDWMVDRVPSVLNSCIGTHPLAAQGLMTETAAYSAKNNVDELYWYCFGSESEPIVLSVRIRTNANGCTDITASPIYGDEEDLARNENGTMKDIVTLEDLLRHLTR